MGYIRRFAELPAAAWRRRQDRLRRYSRPGFREFKSRGGPSGDAGGHVVNVGAGKGKQRLCGEAWGSRYGTAAETTGMLACARNPDRPGPFGGFGRASGAAVRFDDWQAVGVWRANISP